MHKLGKQRSGPQGSLPSRRAGPAGAPKASPSPHPLLCLQRSVGNRSVAQLLGRPPGYPGVVQRDAAPAVSPANAKDRRTFVQDTIDFFRTSTDFYGEPAVKVDEALFDRLLNSWHRMVFDRMAMIDADFAADTSLRGNLRGAYTAAVRVLMRRAAAALQKSEDDLYRENSGRIPMWAWPTPHHQVAGITTPIPEGLTANAATRNVEFNANGFAVTIAPDIVSTALQTSGETGITIKWPASGSYRWQSQGGKKRVISFVGPQPPAVRIQTSYRPGVQASGPSGYGRGTTPQDRAGGQVNSAATSLGFHEGSHGLAYVEYLNRNPPPVFGGKVGMTVGEFKAAIAAWQREQAAYTAKINDHSLEAVDCVGTTIDQYHKAHAAPGKKVKLVCPQK